MTITASRMTDAVAEPETSAETPFLEVYSGPIGLETASSEEVVPETPFLSEYATSTAVVSESGSAFRELLQDLYDSEFDEALAELVEEADARAHLLGHGELEADEARIERSLEQWIQPLRSEAEALIDSMASALETSDPRSMSESEVDLLFESFEATTSAEGPVFEDFLKKLVRKAKGLVKGAVKLVKKGVAAVGKILPIGAILSKLKALIRPLLRQVLKLAMDRLPVALRPAARQLARRFLGVGEMEADGEATVAVAEAGSASPDVRTLQHGFDAEIAGLLLAPGEPEQEAFMAEVAMEDERAQDGSLTELDAARERFVAGLMELEEGEDPTPLVEQFIPAILPALRIGIRIIGRARVVRFLAGLLGRLIRPMVGPTLTPPLSQAIVDAGLRLMTLETIGEEGEGPDDRRVAAEAFASLVEDTVGGLAELEDEELEDEQIVEEVAFEGFRRAAGRSFPAAVLRPAAVPGRAGGVWVAMPRRGRRRYRKYTRIFEVTITPEAAAGIRTWGGRTLAAYLSERLGGIRPVRARLHLYRAIPGTRLGRIARLERRVRGLGPGAARARTRIHPLTREAAMALTGDPELGSEVTEEFLDESAPPGVGQALYYLELEDEAPGLANEAGTAPRPSGTSAAVDLRGNRLTLAVYLAEGQAQAIAARIRRREPLGAVLAGLRETYRGAYASLVSRSGQRRVRILGESVDEAPTGEELLGIPGLALPGAAVGRLLTRWTRMALARGLARQRNAFVEAANAPADGVTLLITLASPPGLAALGSLLRGRMSLQALRSLQSLLKTRSPGASLEIVAGYRRA